MKNIRFLSILITISILMAFSASSLTISENAWYYKYVDYASKNSLVDFGVKDTFEEKVPASTLDVIKAAARLNGDTDIIDFPAYAVEKGYVASTTLISGDIAATREFAATVFSFLVDENDKINDITFIPDISSLVPSYKSIVSLYNSGILNGKDSDGYFVPYATITFEELSAVVSRIANKDFRIKFGIPAGVTLNDAINYSSDLMTDSDKTEQFAFNTGYTVSKAMYDYVNASSEESTTEEEKIYVLKTFAAAEKLLSDYGYAMSEYDFELLNSEFNEHWAMIKQILESGEYNITPYAYITNYWTNMFYTQFYYDYLRNKAPDFDTVYNIYSDSFVLAKHILITFGENTDEAKAEALKKAEEIYSLAVNGADFDALIAEYGEDPGMLYNPGGYMFTYGEMVEPFEKAAFELDDNEISTPVETAYGYHIIKKYPLTKEIFTANTDLCAELAMYSAANNFNSEFEKILEEITH